MLTMEQLLHSPEGRLLTRGPGAYKIPSFNDVPAQVTRHNIRRHYVSVPHGPAAGILQPPGGLQQQGGGGACPGPRVIRLLRYQGSDQQ